MDLLHGLTGLLHCQESLLVDVGGFDGIYLLFDGRDLRGGLFERVFVLLLPSECCFGRCRDESTLASHILRRLNERAGCVSAMIQRRGL